MLSLSARRAWIEIVFRGWTLNINGSLSARRAWIEIHWIMSRMGGQSVALRKESVDRNSKRLCYALENLRRSPQGERG